MKKNKLKHLITFCSRDGDCPKLFINNEASKAKKIVFTDDHGQKIEMSKKQFRDMRNIFKNGSLDQI